MSEVQSKQRDSQTVRVSRRAADRVRAGGVWVYRDDLEGGAEGVAAGSLVRVVDGRGSALGCGTYSTASTIAVRLVIRGDGNLGREGFLEVVRERVGAALRLREEVAMCSEVTQGRRLIFSEADGLPGVVMDQYGPLLMLQLLTQGMAGDDVRRAISAEVKQHFAEVKGGFAQDLQTSSQPAGITLWEREDGRVRELEELPPSPTEPLLVTGDAPQTSTLFRLNGLGFHYDVGAGQKTGAFLDQRLNYQAAADAVARSLAGKSRVREGGRALDVCTYQGGFALHLARVCGRVTGVDASRAALEVADRNLELNRAQIKGEVDWIEADAFELLRAMEEAGERFSAVVLDPPAFAKSKRAAEGAMRGYKELNLRALKMLQPGGVLVTCSCSHHVGEPEFREVVRAAAVDAGRTVQVLESRGAAPDHPEVLTLPETRYLKCLVCRVG